MYTRVRRFFKSVRPDIPSYETLDALFNAESKYQPDLELVAELNQLLPDRNYVNFEQCWWMYLPFLHRLQQYFNRFTNCYGIFQKNPNFETVPAAYGRFKVGDGDDESPNERSHWQRHFCIEQVESEP